MSWYYEVNRQQRGPVSDAEFQGLVQTGLIRPDTLVWQDGWPDWRAYSSTLNAAVSPVGAAPQIPPLVQDADTAVCAVSGQIRAKRDMFEFEGRWVSAEHKEEFFQRLREGVAQPGEVVYAGFWIRFLAKFIDGLILGVINMIVLIVPMVVLFGIIGASAQSGGGPNPILMLLVQVVFQVVGVVVAICFSLFFIRKYDATPGKLALGLRVLRTDGSKLSKGRIVGRYFSEIVSSMILFIGYLMAAFDKVEHKALHDSMCDTRVIKIR